MNPLFIKAKQLFLQGNILTKLIYINVGVFVVINLCQVIITLFFLPEGPRNNPFYTWLELPSSVGLLLHRPWTLITYMFLHVEFLHLLFNLLWLYWFGRIFLLFFNERQMGGLYVWGGIAGAIMLLIVCNTLPYFRYERHPGFLMGASASVMAIVFAVSFYRKEYQINLLLLGRVKLIYLAWGVALIDVLSITSTNAGGHVAHLGGALAGILFAGQMQKGKDLTAPVNRWIDRMVNLIMRRKQARMKVSWKRPETDWEYNARKQNEMDTLNAILEKLKRSGYNSLTPEEKKILFDASKK